MRRCSARGGSGKGTPATVRPDTSLNVVPDALSSIPGAKVCIADILTDPKEGGTPTEEEIAARGGTAVRVQCDISNWADIDGMVGRVVEEWGRLDILVNNAAHWTTTPLTETTPEQWHEVMAVNADGYFMCSKRAVEQMLTQNVEAEARGRIVNITSQHGMIGAPITSSATRWRRAGSSLANRGSAWIPRGWRPPARARPIHAWARPWTWPMPRCSWPRTNAASSPEQT